MPSSWSLKVMLNKNNLKTDSPAIFLSYIWQFDASKIYRYPLFTISQPIFWPDMVLISSSVEIIFFREIYIQYRIKLILW